MQRYAVGTNDMAAMTQIHLHLTSSMFGLHRLNVFLPSLTFLNLDGSSLDSLRDLGSELSLKYLNVSRCGLHSFDGINGMPAVEQLIADNNKIEYVLPLTDLTELQSLSLNGFVSKSTMASPHDFIRMTIRCRNLIKKPELLNCLTLCARLVELNLHDNPIAKQVDYRRRVGEIVPNLMILDGMSVGHNRSKSTEKISSSEFSSSLSSSLSRDIDSANHFSNNVVREIGPMASIERDTETVINVRARPSTAGTSYARRISHTKYSLSISMFKSIFYFLELEPFSDSNRSLCRGDAIVGNIIDKARRERRHRSNMSASESRPSTSSSISRTISSSSNSTTNIDAISDRRFPNVLPQSVVELELGLIDHVPSVPAFTSDSANDTNSNELLLQCGDEAIARLLATARKWRETSQRSRSTGCHYAEWLYFSLFNVHQTIKNENKLKCSIVHVE